MGSLSESEVSAPPNSFAFFVVLSSHCKPIAGAHRRVYHLFVLSTFLQTKHKWQFCQMEEEVEVPQDMKVGPAKVNGLLFNIPL